MSRREAGTLVSGRPNDLSLGLYYSRYFGFPLGAASAASTVCAYFSRNAPVIAQATASDFVSIPVETPREARVVKIASVGMLPTSSSPANGHPPIPVKAPSNLRHPAS